MKKYLFIVPSLSSGGAERAVANLSSQLVQIGEDVTVIKYFSMPNEYEVNSKVKIINLSGGDEEVYRLLSYFKKIRMLRAIIKDASPDFILPFLPQVTIHSTLAGFDMQKKIIHTVRNNPAVMPPNKIMRLICNAIVCLSAKTIVQNEKQRAFYPKRFQKKIYVMFNSVSPELLQGEREKRTEIKNIIGVGRLNTQKNFNMLICAVGRLCEKYPEVTLKIYGEGQERSNLQALIKKLKLNEKVFLMGRSSDVKSVYREADLFVLSSDFEGMPNTLIEAMASGLPCISTDCDTGPSDLIENNKNGILISVNNEDELFQAMDFMCSNPNIAERYGNKARETVYKKCAVEAIALELKKICEEY